jgi:hypothetical protein
MHAIPFSDPIFVIDPDAHQHMIGKTGVIDGHEVELVEIQSHGAVVKDTKTGQKWKVMWGKLVEMESENG